MSYLRLRRHVSFGLVEDHTVFLDIRRDRYFTLEPDGETLFRAAVRNQGACDPSDPGLARLLATDLFTIADGPQALAPASIAIPETALHKDEGEKARALLDLLGTWRLVLRARRALATLTLEEVLDARREDRTGAFPPDPQATARLSARFRRARAFVPIEPTCLQDSIALSDWLSARGASASIVLGVKLNPFAAHCWVQSEKTVLNDAADKVAEFTPVLVVP